MNKPLEIIKRPGQLRLERVRALKRINIQRKGEDSQQPWQWKTAFTVLSREWTEDAEVELQPRPRRAGPPTLHGMVKAIVRKRTESNVQEVSHEIPEGFDGAAWGSSCTTTTACLEGSSGP